MSDIKDRLWRNVRANLNHLLDNIREFEDRGGVRAVFDGTFARPEDDGWEEIGREQPRHSPPPPRRSGGQKTIYDYYANLEVPFGSDLETVRAAYRQLMRKYHPDNYARDPEKEAMATQLSQELSVAYQKIKSYLETGHY